MSEMLNSFKDCLQNIPAEQRAHFGSHHFELIKETCSQLKKIAACLYQRNVLGKVIRWMIFARALGDHRVLQNSPGPFATPSGNYLDVADPGACDQGMVFSSLF